MSASSQPFLTPASESSDALLLASVNTCTHIHTHTTHTYTCTLCVKNRVELSKHSKYIIHIDNATYSQDHAKKFMETLLRKLAARCGSEIRWLPSGRWAGESSETQPGTWAVSKEPKSGDPSHSQKDVNDLPFVRFAVKSQRRQKAIHYPHARACC